MPEYSYKIQNVSGKTFAGKMEAPNEAALLQSLKESGYYPIEVKPAGASKELTLDSFTRVKLKDIAVFCRQFATIISAGITIVNGLDILRHQTENKKLKGILDKVFEQVQKGKSLSETMRQYKEFPPLFVNMVEAGEASGQLEEMLERMAVYYDKEHRLRSKIKSSMMYPMIISIFAIGVVILLVSTVVPMFVDMFKSFNAQLPLPTRILLAVSYGFRNYWYIIFGVIILLIYYIRKYISQGEGRYKYHNLLLKMPVLGKINKKIVTSRFSRTLSTLLSSGIPVIQAMDIVEKTVTNAVVERGIAKCKEEVKKGVGLSKPIGAMGIFPPMLVEMISIGEESGMIDEMLTKTAQFYDDEVDATVSGLTAIIEPIIIVLLAAIVGFVIISIILPMFDMYSLMG